MSEEELNEAIEFNLEYMEAMQSEEIFGGDYTSYVELKYANKEIERLQQRIDKAIEILKNGLLQLDTRPREQVYIEQYLENAIDELKGEDK